MSKRSLQRSHVLRFQTGGLSIRMLPDDLASLLEFRGGLTRAQKEVRVEIAEAVQVVMGTSLGALLYRKDSPEGFAFLVGAALHRLQEKKQR